MTALSLSSFILSVLLTSNILWAQENLDEKPALFEWGILVGHGGLADYPASNEYRFRTLPIPYINYRGELLRSDDQDGTRLELHKNEGFNFDFSFGGSFPTESNQNTARLGMPALDWTIEMGPRMLYYFFNDPKTSKLRFSLPARASFSTDFQRLSQIGYVIAPGIQYESFDCIIPHLNFYFNFNFNYYDRGLSAYFYQVDPQFQTSARSTYVAKEGFLGWESFIGAKYENDGKILVSGFRYSDFSQSANRSSFLHQSDSNWSYFLAFGWLMFESDQRADH